MLLRATLGTGPVAVVEASIVVCGERSGDIAKCDDTAGGNRRNPRCRRQIERLSNRLANGFKGKTAANTLRV
jgi:hypothetical protein